MPDYSKLPFNELWRLCADGGNTQAWDEFLRRSYPFVMTIVQRTAQRYTRADRDLCDDLTQLVYLKFACQLHEFKPTHEGATLAFFNVLTRNLVHDYFRRRDFVRRSQTPLRELPTAGGSTIPELMQVRDIERQIFWLYYRHGFTAKQIAALPALGLTIEDVEEILRRLRWLP